MSVATHSAERAKYGYLLHLAQDQIKALESDDLYAFDRILAAKRAVIESLQDARGMLASDASLATVITHIQDCDKAAQRLLYRKLGRIMREMAHLQQYKKARRAYVKAGRRPANRLMGLLPDTAQLLDRKS